MSQWPNHLRHLNPSMLPVAEHPYGDVATAYPTTPICHADTVTAVAGQPVTRPDVFPLRGFLEDRFPNMSDVVKQYKLRMASRPLLVPSLTETGHFVGTAFGLGIALLADPDAFSADAEELMLCLREDTKELMTSIDRIASGTDREALIRMLLGLARIADLRHPGADRVREACSTLAGSPGHLLGLATDQEQIELDQLLRLAENSLLPSLTPCDSVRSSVFDFAQPKGRRVCEASLDLLADGTLVELKTNKPKKAANRVAMQKEHVTQLIGYVLRDYDDRFNIERVHYYQARHGAGVTWDTDYLLDTAAGRRVDLARTRDDFRRLLELVDDPEAREALFAKNSLTSGN